MAQYNVDQIVYVRANDTSDTYNIVDTDARNDIADLTDALEATNTNVQAIMDILPPDGSTPTQTTGSTNSTQQLYLTGALTQAQSAKTYSNEYVYTTNGVLYALSSIANNNLFPVQPEEGQEESQLEYEEQNSPVLTWNDIQNTELDNNVNKIPNSAVVKSYVDQQVSYNNNWVNGLSQGSIRTVGTKEEDFQNLIFMGEDAVAEGTNSFAEGNSSYAQGVNTIAKFRAQHVFGQYNIPDPTSALRTSRGQYIEIVGNGNPGLIQGAIINEQYTLNIYEESSSSSTQIGILQPGTYPYNSKMRDASGNLWYGLIQPQGYILGVQYDPQIIYVTETEIEPSRSNARTLDWNGNEVLAGKLTVGEQGTTQNDVPTIGQVNNALKMTITDTNNDGICTLNIFLDVLGGE